MFFFFEFAYLGESGGESDKKSGGGPEEGTSGDDVGAVVADGEVGGDWVTDGLNNGPEESERTQTRRVGVQSRTNLSIHTG